MAKPTVSVVMVVRNGEHFLDQAIASVLAQTQDDWEIVLIDGQSSDRTAAIAQSYPQIRYQLQTDQGISQAYNQGIAAAPGEYVAFLSCDDLWTADKLALQVSYLATHPEVQYTVAHTRFFLEPGHTLPSGFRPHLLEGEHPAYIMETLVARRSLFQALGGLDPTLSVAEDVDWFARAKDAQIPSAVLPQVLLHKRIHQTNLSVTSPQNDQNLLTLLRRSIQRKRHQYHHPIQDN